MKFIMKGADTVRSNEDGIDMITIFVLFLHNKNEVTLCQAIDLLALMAAMIEKICVCALTGAFTEVHR